MSTSMSNVTPTSQTLAVIGVLRGQFAALSTACERVGAAWTRLTATQPVQRVMGDEAK